jgi:hypothetical protein
MRFLFLMCLTGCSGALVPFTVDSGVEVLASDTDEVAAVEDTDDPSALLRLNEVVSTNDRSYEDLETGEFPDWIELSVVGLDAVDLTGWTLSDSGTEAPLDGLVAPGASFVVLSADDGAADGPLHLPFKLSSSAEVVTLRAPGGVFVDAVMWSADGMGPYGPQQVDESLARQADDGWDHDGSPTPGAAND